MTPNTIEDLLDFLNSSPTPWHAVDWIVSRLEEHGFRRLEEENIWDIQPNSKYYVLRNGSTLCAFITPNQPPLYARIAASHTDSPGFKLKPNAEFQKENMILWGLEIYGAPLLTSWLNRDLGLAGRIVYESKSGKIEESLVNIEDSPVTIPQLAIHLDRQVNETGLTLNKQEHLAALVGISKEKPEITFLDQLLQKKKSFTHLLGADLFLYPLEKARLMGKEQELFASWRIDNLGGAHACLKGFLESEKQDHSCINMVVFWDHEEIGSNSAQGAGSPFLLHLLERIAVSLKLEREAFLRLISRSHCLSVDLGHAVHPNYADKHDPRHPLLLNQGISLKFNAQHRYASDSRSIAWVTSLCHKHGIPFQRHAGRGDIPSGSTIGPVHASLSGMPTADVGYAQLSMHSCRELAGCQDHLDLCRLTAAYFKDDYGTIFTQ